MAIGTPAIYICDYCKKPIHNGCIGGHHHHSEACNRSGDKNHIDLVDKNGNKPDLCNTCLLKELMRQMGISWTDDVGTNPIMGKYEHYHQEPISLNSPFLYLPSDDDRKREEPPVLKMNNAKIQFENSWGLRMKALMSDGNFDILLEKADMGTLKLIHIDSHDIINEFRRTAKSSYLAVPIDKKESKGDKS